MSIELIVAAISAAISLGAAALGARANQRARELDYQLEQRKKADDAAAVAQRILRQYRDPLLDAAQTLQSRTYNILRGNYLGIFLHCGDPDEERYARDYTVFALAEYLTWVEIVRRELRFLDVGDEEHNRQFLALLTQAQLTIQSSNLRGPFRVFRGNQRAIAELMMVATNAPEGPRNDCLGYAAFCDRLDEDEDFRAWFARLREQVEVLVTREADERMAQLQNDLVDIIDHLDPKALRIPMHSRNRVPRSEPATNGIPVQGRA